MNKLRIGQIILCLIFCLCIQITQAQQALDKLQLNYEKAAKDNPERFFLAGKYVQGLFFNNQLEKSYEILAQNIQEATQQKDGIYAAYLYAIHAMNDRITDQLEAAKNHIEKAQAYAQKSKNQEIKGYVSYCEGWLQVRDSKEGQAVRSFLRAIHYYDQSTPSASLNSRKSSVYKELTAIYSNWNELQLQEKYGKLALNLAIEQNDPIAIFDGYMLMGHMYEQQHIEDPSSKQTRDLAEKYYRQAFQTFNEKKDNIPFPSNLSYVANNLANLYLRYFPDSHEDQVRYYANIAKTQGIATQSHSHVASANGILAEIALKHHQSEDAQAYLEDALSSISLSGVQDQNILLSIYEKLTQIAESESDYAQAIEYQKSYMNTFKSIYNQEQIELGKRLEAQYEKEIHQQELITMQLEADKKEQQISLMQALNLQQKQEYENLKLREANQSKELKVNKLESQKRSQELQLSQLEAQSRTQDILNYKNEISYKEKINKYYISLIIVFLFVVLLLLYAYKQRSKSLRQNKELYNISLEKERQSIKISTLNAMLEGQEKERGRMARDLHDGLGGLLSSTKISLSQLTHQVAAPFKGDLQNSLKQIDTAVEELRLVAHNLMPDLLNKYGLQEALQDYAVRMSNEQLEIDVQFLHYKNDLSKERQLLVYRIIQELVNNAFKHANATQILIQIVEEEDQYQLTVEDDGQGFDVQQTKRNQSAGIHNIQSRIDFLKGEFQIHSEKQIGTSVEISFPKTI